MTSAEFIGLGEEKRKSVGEAFAKAPSEGTWRGRGKKKMKVKVVERLGEGKEALGGRWWRWEECLVEVGDRVVVVEGGGVEGRDRGMIGEVTEVRKVEGEVVVDGLNLVSLRDYLLVVCIFLCEKRLECLMAFRNPQLSVGFDI